MINQKAFIKRLQSESHKETAFSELIDAYQERLYWHIRKIVLTHENTNDVLQNTFMRVFKNIAGFKGQSSLMTWMYRIAYNESIRFLEKNKRTIYKTEELLNNALVNELVDDGFFDGDEIKLRLHKVLLCIPEKERHVFNMKYFDELKFREISELTGIKESTVKSLYYKTVKFIEENIVKVQLSANL